MATQSTLEIFRNADTTVRVDVVTEDGGATPQNMTGWALQFVIRMTHSPKASLVSKTTGSGITIGNGSGTGDRATITVEDTDLDAAAGRDYQWALWRTDAGSDVPLAYGQCHIKEAAAQV